MRCLDFSELPLAEFQLVDLLGSPLWSGTNDRCSPHLPAALFAFPRKPLDLDYRQTLTLITSKWWSKVQTGASKRSLIAASTVSNRVRSWFRYGRIVTAASR